MKDRGEFFVPSLGTLYYEGNLDLLKEKIICIIGTRKPTFTGIKRAEWISKLAKECGYITLSGLARGIDTVVHTSSFPNTIAVIPTALMKNTYPKENRELKSRIIESGGLVITPFNAFDELTKSSFVIRDKVQAYLSKFIIVIESDLNGGSMHALRFAHKNNRMVYIPNDETRLYPLKGKEGIEFVDDESIKKLFV